MHGRAGEESANPVSIESGNGKGGCRRQQNTTQNRKSTKHRGILRFLLRKLRQELRKGVVPFSQTSPIKFKRHCWYVLDRIARKSHIREDIPLFYLRGGFDSKLVRGSDRKLVSTLSDTLARKIVRCEKKNPAVHVYDKALFSALTCGGDFVCTENLSNIVEWHDTL